MSDWQAIMHQSKPLSELNIPTVCPRCLAEDDLTTYKTGSKQEQMKVPICKQCKRTLMREARLSGAGIFAFWAIVCGGILTYLIARDILGDLVMRLGFPWGLFPPLLLIGTPLYALYQFLFASKSVGWPMMVKGTVGGGEIFSHTLTFDNEPYVRLFAVANLPLLWDLTDWGVTPANKLVYPGKGAIDPELKEAWRGKSQGPEEGGGGAQSATS
jgi:hypothetical protein